MEENERPESFGVFKPVGHVVASFPPDVDLQTVVDALIESGSEARDVRRYSAADVVQQVDQDVANASPLASLGQEMNLVKAHRALAEKGYNFLVVKAPEDKDAQRVADVARRFKAERAQSYGRFIIEELIERSDDESQVSESPSRGLDAQTPSGHEKERG